MDVCTPHSWTCEVKGESSSPVHCLWEGRGIESGGSVCLSLV